VKLSLVFVALVVLQYPSQLFAGDKIDLNGYWWTSMTPSFKLGWVSGYAKAMDSAGVIQMSTCASNLPLYKEKFPNLDPKDIFLRMCANNTEFDYDGIPMGQFVDGMDTFYRDYRNKQLEVGWAIQYVRDEIKGKPALELDAEVAMWRRCSAAIQTGDTDQITKACTPNNSAAPNK
jgi:hypothetical protein